jgi:hypothetical protein
MKVFFNSTQLHKIVSLFILILAFSLVAGNTYSQNFVSVKDGEWKTDSTWESTSNCSKWSNVSDGQPPVSKNWGCEVTVVINHEVTYNGNASGFGSGVFTSLEIGPNGKLIFEDNITINGGGSEPEIILAEGAELVVNGKFDIDRGVEIVVPKNAKLTINNFEIGDNRPVVTIEDGAILVVSGETHVRSQSTLNVFGQFQTDELNYSSGGEINIGSSDYSGEVSVSGNMLIGNGDLNMYNGSTLMVGGTSSTGSSGSIYLEDNAKMSLVGDVEMGQGGSMTINDNAEFSFESKYFTSGGANIKLNDNARGTVHDEVIMTNGRLYLNNSSELMLGSTFTATNGAKVIGKQNGAMYVCDYPNSTKDNTNHVSLNDNSFYGMGCFALPVVWKSFEVLVTNNNISKLVWETTSEDGNSHFEVERSINGIGDFEKIASINGSGWTNTISKYTFEDPELSKIAGMVYYRIRQVDFDGNQMVSDVVSIKASGEEPGEEPILLTAYPNPTDGSSLNIKLASGKISGPVNVRFLQTSSVVSFEGEVGVELDQWLLTVVNNASKGMGVLEVIYEGEAYRMKIIKI